MELFKGQSLLEFTERFKTDLDCEEYLASLKWEDGYCCRKCGHKKYQVRKDFSRTCNICGDTESPTAGTLFHRLKFGLRKAFFICFEMTTTTKGLSASQVARRYEISRQTAHYFMQKVREAMKSSESHKMNDSVQVDEFTIGGKEEGKQGRSYEIYILGYQNLTQTDIQRNTVLELIAHKIKILSFLSFASSVTY